MCVLDECQAGATKCEGNALATCDAQKQSWGPPQPCPSLTTCKATGTTATCEPWVCQAGQTYCEGDTVIQCSADGLAVVSSVDCAAQQKHCNAGACSNLACSPNTVFCSGDQVKQCDATGSNSSVVGTCGLQQVCDPATATCVSPLCVPNATVCNGDTATTCNASGSGYAPGGTDCAAQGKTCSNGVCSACAPAGGPPTHVRMTEVFIGTNDYILLTNLGDCSAQVDSLSLRIAASEASNDIELDMPSRVLTPGESVYVIDAAGAQGNDITPPNGDNIFLTPDTGGYVMLCIGSCGNGVVQDYFAHASGAQPPPPPAGLAFTPAPLTGITTTDQDTNAYKRIAFAGSYPAFKATDWQVGAASRPYENPPSCPATKPADGSGCAASGAMCQYAGVVCTCIMQWICL